MYFVNSCKKLNFSLLTLSVVLLCIVSTTFGTISSQDDSAANNLQNKQIFNSLIETKRFNFLTNNTTVVLSGKEIGRQTNEIGRIATNSSNTVLAPTTSFVVNSELDAPDADTADGVCATSANVCSLRAAIEQANALASDDVITFAPGLRTITLSLGTEIVVGFAGTLQINGPGANVLTISGNDASRIFYINTGSVTITDVTLTGGNGTGAFVTGYGGAIYSNAGSLALDRVHVIANTAEQSGGGVYFSGGTNNRIQNSTFSANSAKECGGGFFYDGINTMAVVNTTISGNKSVGNSGYGGGFCFTGAMTLRSVTITNNAASDGGGFNTTASSTKNLSMVNTIVAGNAAATHSEIGFLSGGITSEGNNLIGDSAGDSTDTGNPIIYQPTDIRDTPPQLAVLQNYGGTTPTNALLTGSPAINAGNNVNAPPTDQRGFARIVDGTIDIGAFESSITISPASFPNTIAGGFYSQTLTAVSQNNSPGPITFSISDGSLPIGLTLSANGVLSGTPTTNGTYIFTVKATAADGSVGVRQYTIIVGCFFSISPSNQSFTNAGGNGTVNVTSTPGCSYTAVSNASWITITSAFNGNGNGTVKFTVAVNTGIARTGTITIAGQTFTVSQESGCAYTLSPTGASIPGNDATGSFNISAGAGCAYTATSNDSFITITSGASGTGNGTVSYSITANTDSSARLGTITVAGQIFTINQTAAGTTLATKAVRFDFDGDRRADISVFRPDTGFWYLLDSTAGFNSIQFGRATDKLVPADYDGDGKTDIAVWRDDPNNPDFAYFYILNSSNNTNRVEQFGRLGDSPMAVADWDGDGKADPAVYRNGTFGGQSYFFYRPSSQPGVDFVSVPWGVEGDKPVVGDYDGDGKADAAVYRPGNGVWYILGSRDGFNAVQFGISTDRPVVGDYDGDGKSDVAVYRPSNGVWYLLRSASGFTAAQFGTPTDIPVPADYDGDGKTDIAVFRPENNNWYLLRSALGYGVIQFGESGDRPVPNAFVP